MLCVTDSRATPVTVGERVAIRHGNAAIAPDDPTIDLV
jgi:hypothetical protein